MIETSLIIQVDALTMRKQLEQLFCDAFACGPQDLLDHPHISPLADGKVLSQTLFGDQNGFVLETLKEKDKIKTEYRLTPINAVSCKVSLAESAESNIKSRQLNYVFFSLPLVNLFTQKKLKRKLSILKAQVENRRPYADH